MRAFVDILFAPPQFADADIFHENHLKQRVIACLKSRLPGRFAALEFTVLGHSVIFRSDSMSVEERRLCYEYCRHVPGVRKVIDQNGRTVGTEPRMDTDQQG